MFKVYASYKYHARFFFSSLTIIIFILLETLSLFTYYVMTDIFGLYLPTYNSFQFDPVV